METAVLLTCVILTSLVPCKMLTGARLRDTTIQLEGHDVVQFDWVLRSGCCGAEDAAIAVLGVILFNIESCAVEQDTA
jgi:hypothetical protein